MDLSPASEWSLRRTNAAWLPDHTAGRESTANWSSFDSPSSLPWSFRYSGQKATWSETLFALYRISVVSWSAWILVSPMGTPIHR